MTQAELDALPEASMVVLWATSGEACSCVDANGVVWTIGWHAGKRWKSRGAAVNISNHNPSS